MGVKTFNDVLKEIQGKKILVANRGITARRVLRSIRERFHAVPVLTATKVDMTSPSVAGARELILLGEDPRAYLDIDLIIREAKARRIAAIHPGWGFASEDHTFPAKCAEAGIVFIGPTSEAMNLLGNKVAVRNVAKNLGIPVVPGSEGAVSVPEAREIASQITFPIMLKAEGGGGGRGIYVVHEPKQLEEAFSKASALAQASFGNPRLYVEKYLRSVRHIEIQVIADKHGNVLALDERDCTVQRNHQKLVEITPSPWKGMTAELREQLKEWAEKLVKHVGYYSLATVEFLVEPDGTPYLIEVNTRLQVEHGITECRYGIDLVEEQISVAFGGKLRYSKTNAKPFNWCVQVRINCEDPRQGFTPNAGLITRYISPGGPGVRLDSCISAGYEFPSQYDSAGALLMAYGRSWEKVLGTMDRALREYIVGGPKTTIPFHLQVINHPRFRSGDYDTNFIATAPELLEYHDVEPEALRLSKLVSEISAKGYNPHVQLGEYRGRADKRLGRFTPAMPVFDRKAWKPPYPRGDRQALLDQIRDSGLVHFVDTTTRDITQSNSGNRFRLAEDALIGPYLDNCGFLSLENGGGAHFHVAMMANMTYPFTEGEQWNCFAPKTCKQILIRSTNVLGYKPQPRNLMRLTGEMICEHYDIIRCFDFLNHIENMQPFAEVALNSKGNVFQPAISLSWAKGFDVHHYMGVLEDILECCAKVAGLSKKKVSKIIILALKDMAGMCPPRFVSALVAAIRDKYPDLVVDYHRHYTDGLFVPAVGAAAKAGAHIVDTAIGASVRWYGQGEVLSTAAYLEDELGLKTSLNKEMIRTCGFVLKQVMPYYDRYTAPYFQGIDYDVVEHGMPGGATSSSQEGALKQGYIHLLPYMLKFLAGTRRIVRYHDVTPGSQITWNTAFLAVTGAYKRGGERAVRDMLEVLDATSMHPDECVTQACKADRLMLYADANDAFRQLLLGKYGKLPLGWPPDWVYESAFGPDWRAAIEQRTTDSPLASLKDVDLPSEEKALAKRLQREPTPEEFVMYLNHPGDALKTIEFRTKFGDPNRLPLDVWFEGLEPGQELFFEDSRGKPHTFTLLDISAPDHQGMSVVRYVLDSEILSHQVKVAEALGGKGAQDLPMADPNNPFHVAAPCNGDLWVMHVSPGDFVKPGQAMFNISVMKQEKSVLAQVEGVVKRVLKNADYFEDKKMVPVKEGELLVELAPVGKACPGCKEPLGAEDFHYCPWCGYGMEYTQD
ncbi:2-oxoglutarate carboxylase small subunit [Fundidesulfovibrio magnetotacticus]|uniref:pyruvate carboxylase n=1 Tax=Fundidesulfovibrio magnetotacticus TaxID=2730080 RepID=A0A6V8LNE8_9BACT|nr:pyruvate carboxylase [Fundidesulfovibrio magnetotacticus]GFK92530.1 2-oxoglutarate carboxylase small subunit [Fundidesulfovibrio magnetotacticus]